MEPIQHLVVVRFDWSTRKERLVADIQTAEPLSVPFIQAVASAKLNIDPDCVACRPISSVPDNEVSGTHSFMEAIQKPASTAVCPPYRVKFDNDTGVWQRYFPNNSHCWGCDAQMSKNEFKTKSLPVMCGHTLCEKCAQKIVVGDPEVTLFLCAYCGRPNLASPNLGEAIISEGLGRNSFGIIKVEKCSNLLDHHNHSKTRYCLIHNELVCTDCGPPNSSCQLVMCDDPEALKRLNEFANHLAFELDAQRARFIKDYRLIGKYEAFLGTAYDTIVRMAVKRFTLDHNARVLQLRADILHFGLSPSLSSTSKQVSKFPDKSLLRWFQGVSLALSFRGMLRQLQCPDVEYLKFLRSTGFLAVATSARDSLGRNLWHYALPQASLKLLKEWGADFSTVDAGGRTAAHCASRQGDAERLRVVCALGTNPKERDPCGRTAAHYAAIYDHVQCLEVLPATCLEKRDADRWTPAHYAALKGSARCIAFLLSRGVSLLLVETPQGELPVHLAALGCHINVLHLLHNADLDLAMPNIKDGVTAIHIAAQGRLDCLKWLHEHSYRLDDPVLDDTRRTALHIAALHDAPDCLELILRHANETRDTRTHDGKTAAHFAAERGSVACLKILREVGASMTLADADRRKPLDLAARKGHPACLDVLRHVPYSRADVNEALSLAESQGCATCVETLHRWAEALDSAPQPADPSTVRCVPRLSLLHRTGTDSSSATSTASSARTVAAPYPTSRPDLVIREIVNHRIQVITEDEYNQFIRSGVPEGNHEQVVAASR